MSIKKDCYNSPHLFILEKVGRDFISKDIPSPPKDLFEFWTEYGAGEIFETETIYSPSANGNEDTIQEVNEHLTNQGMSSNYTVFHTGIAVSAYRNEKPRYVILNEKTFDVVKYFGSFEEWYSNTIRKEYAERYGL